MNFLGRGMMKDKCLNDYQKNLYLQYLTGVGIEDIDPIELQDIESHLYLCESCFNEIQKRYDLLMAIESWTVETDNESLIISDFITVLRHIDSEKLSNYQKNLINFFLSNQCDYNTVEMREFFSYFEKGGHFNEENLLKIFENEDIKPLFASFMELMK